MSRRGIKNKYNDELLYPKAEKIEIKSEYEKFTHSLNSK